MPPTATPGPGHPATDIALRLRNWLWYWQVKQTLGLSDDALDRQFLAPPAARGEPVPPSLHADPGRKRVFERIRNLGSDPTQPRLDLYNGSVFDRVHANREKAWLERVRRDFESPLWQMLTRPRWADGDTERLIETLVDRGGWYRAAVDETAVAAALFPDDIAFGHHAVEVEAAACTHWELNPCADNVALLAALYRETWQSTQLEEAVRLRSSLRRALRNWLRDLGWHASQERQWRLRGMALHRLVECRLVKNRWAHRELPPTRSQREYVRELVRAYCIVATPDSQARERPVVQRSPSNAWLRANRAAAVAMAEELGIVEMTLRMLGPVTLDNWDSHQRWRAYADKVRTMLDPIRPAGMEYCLPARPGLQRATTIASPPPHQAVAFEASSSAPFAPSGGPRIQVEMPFFLGAEAPAGTSPDYAAPKDESYLDDLTNPRCGSDIKST